MTTLKPAEDYERDYFREQFIIESEKRMKTRKLLKQSQYTFDKKRLGKVKQELKGLKEC